MPLVYRDLFRRIRVRHRLRGLLLVHSLGGLMKSLNKASKAELIAALVGIREVLAEHEAPRCHDPLVMAEMLGGIRYWALTRWESIEEFKARHAIGESS